MKIIIRHQHGYKTTEHNITHLMSPSNIPRVGEYITYEKLESGKALVKDVVHQLAEHESVSFPVRHIVFIDTIPIF